MAPTVGVMPPVAAELPDHDYLQHGLGDDEDWGVQRQVTAAPQFSLSNRWNRQLRAMIPPTKPAPGFVMVLRSTGPHRYCQLAGEESSPADVADGGYGCRG